MEKTPIFPQCIKHGELLAKHDEQIQNNKEQIQEMKEMINMKRLMFYQIIGTILSGVTTSIILNVILK